MLIGYMRVSKADGSQTTDPQRDALLEAGVNEEQLYQDRASRKKDDVRGWSRASRPSAAVTRSSCGSLTGSAATCTTWSTPCTTSPLEASD